MVSVAAYQSGVVCWRTWGVVRGLGQGGSAWGAGVVCAKEWPGDFSVVFSWCRIGVVSALDECDVCRCRAVAGVSKLVGEFYSP